MGIKLRGDGSSSAFHIAALAFLILATGLTALLSPLLLLAGLLAVDRHPIISLAVLFVFFVLPLLGWTLLLVRRPIAALTAASPPLLLGLGCLVAWVVMH